MLLSASLQPKPPSEDGSKICPTASVLVHKRFALTHFCTVQRRPSVENCHSTGAGSHCAGVRFGSGQDYLDRIDDCVCRLSRLQHSCALVAVNRIYLHSYKPRPLNELVLPSIWQQLQPSRTARSEQLWHLAEEHDQPGQPLRYLLQLRGFRQQDIYVWLLRWLR